MTYEQAKSYLYGLMNYGSSYGVDRMRLLSETLKNPEKKFPIIHVAGTNGKGSVCAMLEAIYRQNGYKTGLFTSPHLMRLEERIQINRKPISEKEFIEYVDQIKAATEVYEKDKLQPSFFEIVSAIGFLYFEREKIDMGIIETGLGGRFDSTNIVEPFGSVITSISFDHTEILGESLESIAMAKAGIIKPAKPVIIGPMPIEAESVIRRVAREQRSPLFSVDEVYGRNPEDYPVTVLQGTFQRNNAATALLTAQAIKNVFPIDDSKSLQALRNTDWPGRWQMVIIGVNKLILDCSHNEAGARGLFENLNTLIQTEKKKPIIVVGVLGEYRAKAIMPVIAQCAETIILVAPNNPRAIATNSLRALIPKDFHGTIIEKSVHELIASPDGVSFDTKGCPVVITGSIYLVGEIMERLGINKS